MFPTRRSSFLTLLLVALFVASAAPATAPKAADIVGYEIGSQFTPYDRILAYFHALDTASPLLELHDFGKTWEGRPLVYAVITSEKNQAAIADIRARITEINHPERTSREAATSIATSTPAIVWLAFGVHGNESSSSEAAMLTAEWLLSDSDEVRALLDRVVVVIDPLENPDGRERYVQGFRQRAGASPNPDPDAWEHVEPWPGGRYNHYLIDMNRDWAWATQMETRARIAAFQEWNPQVSVDLHEMGYSSTYFFPPSASPMNSNVDPDTKKWLEVFGKANAEVFTNNGWPFFVGEVYDLFYPGYGDSWPSLRGAIGMTFEMAGGGRAGMTVERRDGTLLTLAERATKHFTTARTTVLTAAAHREELILHAWTVLRRQIDAPAQSYLILDDSPSFRSAIHLLIQQGIEVRSLRTSVRVRATGVDNGTAETRDFPSGTAVVTTRQPLGALARTLLERSPRIPEEFVKEQREKVQADESQDFYDITGWSIPTSHNLTAFVTDVPFRSEMLGNFAEPEPTAFREAKFAWLVDGLDSEVYRAVGALLHDDVRFGVSSVELNASSRRFARGTIVIRRDNNDEDLAATLAAIAKETGAAFVAVDSGWTEGTSLGSNRIEYVGDPGIVLLGSEGTSPTSFGQLWYALDAEYAIPHTVVPLSRFGSFDLADHHVIVMPDGDGYSDAIGEKGVARLEEWVKGGGTVVAIGRAAAYLRSKDVEISSAKTWDEKADEDKSDVEKRHTDWEIPGAAFHTTMNSRSHLTFGITSPPPVLLEGSTVLMPLETKADNIVTIRESDPVMAGFVWPESIERISGAAYMIEERVGRGRVITFVDEPYYRMFWKGTVPLFLNAVLYSPSFAN